MLIVTNELGRPVESIRSKKCDLPDYAFEKIEATQIAAGHTLRIPLGPGCIDLEAYDERGRLVGQQRNLPMVQGATWTLRR